MKKAFTGIILALTLLLGISPISSDVQASTTSTSSTTTVSAQAKTVSANSVATPGLTSANPIITAEPPVPDISNRGPEFPDPITRLGYVVYIDCPVTLLQRRSDTDEWTEADYIEPEFEVAPESVLWVVEPDQEYCLQVDFGGRTQNVELSHTTGSGVDYNISIIFTGDLDEGTLGTLRVELDECFADQHLHIVYRGVLKFVADHGANLFCQPDSGMNQSGVFSAHFRPRQEGETYCHTFTTDTPLKAKTPVSVLLDPNNRTVYDTDLSHYLYPHGVPAELEQYFEDLPTLNPDLKPAQYAVG